VQLLQETNIKEHNSTKILTVLMLSLSAVDLCSGGLSNAILDTMEIGGSALGLFLRSQRTWNCKPLDNDAAELFKKTLKVLYVIVDLV